MCLVGPFFLPLPPRLPWALRVRGEGAVNIFEATFSSSDVGDWRQQAHLVATFI